jgi:hypothetical protein
MSANMNDANADLAAKNRPPHWYRLYLGECPVCGRDKTYRERVYGPRPAKESERYVQQPDTDTYDGCLG